MAANDIQILQENGSSDYVYRIVGVTASGQVLITNASKIPEMRALTIADITALATTLAAKIPTTEKGTASGVATLGTDGKIPAAQLPDSLSRWIAVSRHLERFYKYTSNTGCIKLKQRVLLQSIYSRDLYSERCL